MTGLPPNDPAQRPYAPPIAPTQPAAPPTPSSWPKVLGVLGIVLASLGLLGALSAALSPLWADAMQSMMPAGQEAATDVARSWYPYTAGVAVVDAILGGLLLAAGIDLVRRRRRAVQRIRLWAALKIPWVVVTTIVQVAIQRETFAAMEQTMPFSTQAMVTVTLATGVLFALILGWGPPVFALIWINRRKIREEVSGWS